VRATLHQQFYRFLGYRIDLGYTRTAENYLGGGFVNTPNGFEPARGAIGTNVYETAVSYVIEAPEHRGRFTPFGDAGGALLTFLPTQSHDPDAVQVRPALGFGAGLNYRLSSHLGLRAEYRGLFYKNPDFKTSGFGDFVTTKNFTVTNEPTISLVYTFKSAKKGK
jgi:opacity protein-like surface antigen